MKSLFILCFFTVVLCNQLKWEKETYPYASIHGNGHNAMDFPADAFELKYDVGCSAECNVFLMEKAAYTAFKDHRPHSSLKEDLNTHHSFEHFYDQHIISHVVTLVVVNPNPNNPLTATIVMEYLHEEHSYNFKQLVQLGVVGLLGACIFSLIITLLISLFSLGGIFCGMWCGYEKEVNNIMNRIWSNKKHL